MVMPKIKHLLKQLRLIMPSIMLMIMQLGLKMIHKVSYFLIRLLKILELTKKKYN